MEAAIPTLANRALELKAPAALAARSDPAAFYGTLLRAAFAAAIESAAVARGLDPRESPFPGVSPNLLPPREFRRATQPITALISRAGPNFSTRDLGAAHEFMLELSPDLDRRGRFSLLRRAGHARKSTGSYYTPEPLIDHILDVALEPILDETEPRSPDALLNLRLCDPACGSGHFLTAASRRILRRLGPAAARRTPTVLARCLYGLDKSPLAADLTRAVLWLEFSRPDHPAPVPPDHIASADALLDDWPARFPDIFAKGGFDAVLGNPPFLNQLGAATATDRADAARLKALYPGVSLAYTDPAALFLVLASRITRPGGRIALVLPQSFLASRDARGVRAEVARRGRPESLWIAAEHIFEAQVLVCAPAIHIAGPRRGPLRRSAGADFRPLPHTTIDADALTADDSWAPLAAPALGIPEIHLPAAASLADLATATADFRDQYYGLRGLLNEDADIPDSAKPRFPLLVTTGLIDPAACLWGHTPTRFDGRAWRAPRIDLARLESTTELGPWARQRLVPKILLATQTRILEAAADPDGHWLPTVPLITIVPKNPADLWRLAAALLAPPLSAWAAARYALTALSPGAIKLSAKQVLGLPMPEPSPDWDEAATLARAASQNDPARPNLLSRAAELMLRAYRIDPAQTTSLLAWWQDRLPARRR